ncbi:MAG: hypothetical protein NTV06_05580 [candidate division Zixibacteria bacterium]|nr:hypothetical protein [candidate division Zixibacteria bacterium]
MNLYSRTFQSLTSYWRYIIFSSLSAAFYAVLSGILVWMAGPLLMTLFAITDLPVLGGMSAASQIQTRILSIIPSTARTARRHW